MNHSTTCTSARRNSPRIPLQPTAARLSSPKSFSLQPNLQPSSRNSLQPTAYSLQPKKAPGFTIIELLAVMTLIAMLAALLFGAAQFVIKTARVQRANSTAQSLQVAVCTYRHEYGKWPVPSGLSLSAPDSTYGLQLSQDITNQTMLIIPATKNWVVFDMLRASTNNTPGSNPDNANDVHFIDDTAIFAESSQHPLHNGQIIRRFLLPSDTDHLNLVQKSHSLSYQNRNGTYSNFTVKIWFDLEKAEVNL